VAEAYDVLSDPQKRKIFDVYGEGGSPAGAPALALVVGRRRFCVALLVQGGCLLE